MIDSICNWFHSANNLLSGLKEEQFHIAVLYEEFRRGWRKPAELKRLLTDEEYRTMLDYRSYMLDAQRRGQIACDKGKEYI